MESTYQPSFQEGSTGQKLGTWPHLDGKLRNVSILDDCVASKKIKFCSYGGRQGECCRTDLCHTWSGLAPPPNPPPPPFGSPTRIVKRLRRPPSTFLFAQAEKPHSLPCPLREADSQPFPNGIVLSRWTTVGQPL